MVGNRLVRKYQLFILFIYLIWAIIFCVLILNKSWDLDKNLVFVTLDSLFFPLLQVSEKRNTVNGLWSGAGAGWKDRLFALGGVCGQLFSRVQLFCDLHGLWSARFLCPWDFPRKNTGGLPFPSLGDLPDPGIEPVPHALVGRYFTTEPPGEDTLITELSRSCVPPKSNCASSVLLPQNSLLCRFRSGGWEWA